jgi:hypothetical protein
MTVLGLCALLGFFFFMGLFFRSALREGTARTGLLVAGMFCGGMAGLLLTGADKPATQMSQPANG